jgi:hypothetical protein
MRRVCLFAVVVGLGACGSAEEEGGATAPPGQEALSASDMDIPKLETVADRLNFLSEAGIVLPPYPGDLHSLEGTRLLTMLNRDPAELGYADLKSADYTTVNVTAAEGQRFAAQTVNKNKPSGFAACVVNAVGGTTISLTCHHFADAKASATTFEVELGLPVSEIGFLDLDTGALLAMEDRDGSCELEWFSSPRGALATVRDEGAKAATATPAAGEEAAPGATIRTNPIPLEGEPADPTDSAPADDATPAPAAETAPR